MIMDPVFIVAYVGASFLVALLGHNRRVGVLGFFILSLLLTPVVIFLVLIVTRPKPPDHRAHSAHR